MRLSRGMFLKSILNLPIERFEKNGHFTPILIGELTKLDQQRRDRRIEEHAVIRFPPSGDIEQLLFRTVQSRRQSLEFLDRDIGGGPAHDLADIALRDPEPPSFRTLDQLTLGEVILADDPANEFGK